MSRVSLVLGFHFSLPPCFSDDEAERLYHRSIVPLIGLLARYPKLKVTIYFSGNLLDWLKKKHKESLFQLKNFYSRHKQIEFLSCGYYEPALQLISPRSRTYQIEQHYITIRDTVGKGVRSKGFWLNDGNWESSFPSLLQSMGFLYTFVDDTVVLSCGFSAKDAFDVFLTEDQGRTLFLFPIIRSLSFPFCEVPVDDYFDNLKQLQSTLHDDVVTIFKNGFALDESSYEWIGTFAGRCLDASFSFVSPAQVLTPGKEYKRVYIPSSIGIPCSGKMFFNEKFNCYDLLSRRFESTEYENLFEKGHFRNFLVKYQEAGHLYNRIRFVESYLKTLKTAEQKQVIDIFAEGQAAYPLRKGDDAGVFDAPARQKSYTALIAVEKMLRRSGEVPEIDFDDDGLPEFFYFGQTLTTLIHRKGAALRELDYLPSSFNYINTFCDYDPKGDFGVFLRRRAACFQDFFLPEKETTDYGTTLHPGEFRTDLSDFVYELESQTRQKRIFRFALSLPDNVEMRKEYSLKRNDVSVEYQFYSTGNQNQVRYFGTELNISFPDCRRTNVRKGHCDTEYPLGRPQQFRHVTELKLSDPINETVITLGFSRACDIFIEPVFAETEVGGETVSLYQHVSVKIVWKVELRAESSWVAGVSFNIVRAQVRG
ncbi:MAG: alpha-amylase/4-alpha-glucanotransferase domain-containing protein [Spirochaetia bacterium]|nr:alpha-amylase/4-alpha-glucanotransferase domain-containing protein [Spirochaetia bacterium]